MTQTPSKRTVTLVIPDERPLSWNNLYSANMHWRERSRWAKEKHLLVRAYIDPEWEKFKQPVQITFAVYFKDRPQDVDNIAPKMYIDGLKGWLIEDDDWNYVQRLVIEKPEIDKENPRIEIHIEEIEGTP